MINKKAQDPSQVIKTEHGKVEVGFFMPKSEITSNIVINMLAEQVVAELPHVNLVLFLTEQPDDKRVLDSEELNKKKLCNHLLLEDIVFPFQEKNKDDLPAKVLLSPKLLADKFNTQSGARVRIVENVEPNDAAFIEQHINGNNDLKMCFSVRNLTLFKMPLIEALNAKKESILDHTPLINIHPAHTKKIRGLEGPFWTRVEGDDEYTATMHVIDDEEIDTGPILGYKSTALNGYATKSVSAYMRDRSAPQIAGMIFDHLHLVFKQHGSTQGINLGDGEGNYYTLPTDKELADAKEKGIEIIDPLGAMTHIMNHYANEQTHPAQYAAMSKMIETAWEQHCRGNYQKPEWKNIAPSIEAA